MCNVYYQLSEIVCSWSRSGIRDENLFSFQYYTLWIGELVKNLAAVLQLWVIRDMSSIYQYCRVGSTFVVSWTIHFQCYCIRQVISYNFANTQLIVIICLHVY